jgi:hypothetical protein
MIDNLNHIDTDTENQSPFLIYNDSNQMLDANLIR